jgi:lipopolysaccharide export system permease LptF/LptG-like protein
MTIDHPVRRWLARVCSSDTMARIVDPTLADMRVEGHRWRGYLALARALLMHGAMSLPGAVARAWSDDERAIPRALGFWMAVAIVTALPFVVMPLAQGIDALPRDSALVSGGPAAWLEVVVLLLPQALVLTLPAALLLAFPIAFKRSRTNRSLARRAVALTTIATVVAGVLLASAMPRANQEYRILISGDRDIARGPNETGFAALARTIADLQTTQADERLSRRLEFTYHARLGLLVAPLPFGLLSLALTATPIGKRRPWLTGTSAIAAYAFVFFPIELGIETLVPRSHLPVPLLVWLPYAAILVMTVALGRSASRSAQAPGESPEPA